MFALLGLSHGWSLYLQHHHMDFTLKKKKRKNRRKAKKKKPSWKQDEFDKNTPFLTSQLIGRAMSSVKEPQPLWSTYLCHTEIWCSMDFILFLLFLVFIFYFCSTENWLWSYPSIENVFFFLQTQEFLVFPKKKNTPNCRNQKSVI